MITLNLSDRTIKSLSRPELEILKYAYDNSDHMYDITIHELAKEVSYSPATILRFCKKLGYSGFAEFKYALRSEIRKSKTETSVHTAGSFGTSMLVDAISMTMQTTSKLIQEEQLNQTFRYFDSNCPIYLWSPGGLTSVAAEYFEKLLLLAGRQEVYLIGSLRMCEHVIRTCPKNSLLILISASGRYETTIRLGKIAQVKGISILSISPYINNEMAEIADISFRFFTNEKENLGAEFTSRLPIFYIIDSIIQCYINYKKTDFQQEKVKTV